MARIVVVASSELDRDALASILEPDDELHVVVAAVEQSRLQWLANDEGIVFPETRQYVDEVLHARDVYADTYADELGLD